MEIKLICVGKIKEKYLQDGINEYLKRVSPYIKVNLVEVKEVNTNDINKNMCEEGALILNNITDDFVITLEINGNNLDSVAFSEYIFNHYTYQNKMLTIVIGGSDGLSDEVKARSNYRLSFGKMTYPHQLMRMILLEQLYRAAMIHYHHKYHK
jgi:23S rRNA (pseudouridine1915-N3)-methyltransferase